jgi:Mrp family chromosome partitioning ATPase
MTDTSASAGSDNVLQILKSGGKILYPDLIVTPPRTLARKLAGEDGPGQGRRIEASLGTIARKTAGEPVEKRASPLSWNDFPLLPSLRDPLNFLWGRLILKEHEVRKNIAFYGCTKQVGTTFLSFHLAVFAALGQGLKTIYIDTDCDKNPDDSHPLGETGLPGLLSAFFEGIPVTECIYETRVPNLYVLPSGRRAAGRHANQFPPTETIKGLAESIHDQFDVVIYDCQSVLLKPIEITYAQQVNNIILVSRYAVSRREVCSQVIETFKANNLDISGVVLNQREYPIPKNIYDMLK